MRLTTVVAGCSIAIVTTACGNGSSAPTADSSTSAAPAQTTQTPTPEPVTYRLQEAKQMCKDLGMGKGMSGSRTYLSVDQANQDDAKAMKAIGCLIYQLDTPKYVIKMMENTTALMGVQTMRVDGLKYRWTFHPDNGLDIVVVDTRVA